MSTKNNAPSFIIGDGKVVTSGLGAPLDSSYDIVRSILVLPDGKIVLGGDSNGYYSGDSSAKHQGLALVRYNVDGSLDTTFGTDGGAMTQIGNGDSDGWSIALQPDGKIVEGGYSRGLGFALVRYDVDGSLDTTFGTGGKADVVTLLGKRSEGYSVKIQPDGKILMSGSRDGLNQSMTTPALVRWNADGSLDKTFGRNGVVMEKGWGGRIGLQPDGKIVMAGGIQTASSYNVLVRYNADGSLDTSFKTGGGAAAQLRGDGFSVADIAIQPDGKVVAAGTERSFEDGSSYEVLALARYNADGSPDTSFGKGGKAVMAAGKGLSDPTSVTLQPDGKIVLGGTFNATNTNKQFALARWNADGSLDTSFGDGGRVSTHVGMGWEGSYGDQGRSVTVQADGKILLGGFTQVGNTFATDFALVRYNADGSLDRSFGRKDSLGGATVFTEDGAAVVLDDDARVWDEELAARGNYGGATLTLSRAGGAATEDVFGASGKLGKLSEGGALVVGKAAIGTVSQNAEGKLILAFDANATQALVDAVLRQITYKNSSDAPPASVELTWLFSDGNTGEQGTGGAKTASGTTTVAITGTNDAPVITFKGGKATASLSDAENGSAAAAMEASDKDGDKLVWSIAGGADDDLFSINAKTGKLSFEDAPDFELPRDANKGNVYKVTVRVSDGEASDLQKLSIRVKDVVGITKSGKDKADKLTGTAEDDTLKGKGGNDTLKGKGDDDVLVGGKGNDKLTGGAGADELYGGDSEGGAGNDIFVYTALADSTVRKSGRDTIYDFASGDRIDLRAIYAQAEGEDDKTLSFIKKEEFNGEAGELRYEKTKSHSYIYADTDGDGREDFAIHLDGGITLAETDFLL